VGFGRVRPERGVEPVQHRGVAAEFLAEESLECRCVGTVYHGVDPFALVGRRVVGDGQQNGDGVLARSRTLIRTGTRGVELRIGEGDRQVVH